MKAFKILLSVSAVVIAMVYMFNADTTDISHEGSLETVSATTSKIADASVGEMPSVGDVAPGFTLVSNEGTEVTLSDYQDKWVVLYFYPRDFTGGCTIQAKKFEMDMAEYEERDTVILGVSTDSVESHEEFCTKEGLTFKLLADEDGAVADMYGSLAQGRDRPTASRNTFLINPKGVVAQVFVKVNPTPHSKEVLATLDELQAD